MPRFAQLDDLDHHLALCAYSRGIVAVARPIITRDGNRLLELRAAAWRNRRLESYTQTLREHEVECLGVSEIAARFIELVHSLFPQRAEIAPLDLRLAQPGIGILSGVPSVR
jgi:hypothetical protein